MRIRFVHAADLHLDSPFTGLKAAAPADVANALYHATFDAYENIINLCISEQVDALLVAGDVFDGADRSLRAQLKFVEGLKKLDTEGIRSFVCHGNHDPLDGWQARLDYPPGCRRFGPEWEAVPVFEDPDRALIHGISYRKRDVTENLALRLGNVDPGPFSIGLVHGNVGNNPEHGAYAPCSLDDLAQSGVHYWALGHVHTRQVLNEQGPTVVYPGNPQGRHPNETGARGVYLVEVDDGGNVGLDFRPMDTVRWARLDSDIAALDTEQDLLDALHKGMQALLDGADGQSVVVRVRLTGRGELNRKLRRPNMIEDPRRSNQWGMGRTVAVRLVRANRGRERIAFRPRSQAEGFRLSGGGAADGGPVEDRSGAPGWAWHRTFRPLPAPPLSLVFVQFCPKRGGNCRLGRRG